jgi:hypothetical protein
MDKPQELYALVLSPTRELAIQIAEQFEALGSGIGLKTAVLVGGIDMMAQVSWACSAIWLAGHPAYFSFCWQSLLCSIARLRSRTPRAACLPHVYSPALSVSSVKAERPGLAPAVAEPV